MAYLLKQQHTPIPHGMTQAIISINVTDVRQTATITIEDVNNIQVGDPLAKLDSHFGSKKTVNLPLPPAGQIYNLYNSGPAEINVSWL